MIVWAKKVIKLKSNHQLNDLTNPDNQNSSFVMDILVDNLYDYNEKKFSSKNLETLKEVKFLAEKISNMGIQNPQLLQKIYRAV